MDTHQTKLSAYIVKVDSGFAPNPFGRRCTLACCKPRLRLHAKVDDIVIGTGSAASDVAGKLIYAMRVGEVLPFEDYWTRFPSKRPTPISAITKCGDNIWRKTSSGDWRCVKGAFHDESHQQRDLSGKHVLIASEFYYFGQDAIDIPERFKPLVAVTQGYKNTLDVTEIKAFWRWLEKAAPKLGRIGDPAHFTSTACRIHRGDHEDDEDDLDECAPPRRWR
jgi:hypothetical protein